MGDEILFFVMISQNGVCYGMKRAEKKRLHKMNVRDLQ
ncbi:hypothetical protein CHCC14596_1585 [Bacillus licheniformis]|nr:hypothetical protein CHCC14596_1585 [Bacillus licheniformis]